MSMNPMGLVLIGLGISAVCLGATVIWGGYRELLPKVETVVKVWRDDSHVTSYEGGPFRKVILNDPTARISCHVIHNGDELHQWAARADGTCHVEDWPNRPE